MNSLLTQVTSCWMSQAPGGAAWWFVSPVSQDVGWIQTRALCWALKELQISCIGQVALLKDK